MLRYTIGDQTVDEDWFDPLSDNFEDYAIRDLVRELNRGNVVAFVGSGVSAAYGIPGWRDLVTKIVNGVIDTFNNYQKAVEDTPEYKKLKIICSRLNYLKYIKLDDAETLMTMLELCEALLVDLSKIAIENGDKNINGLADRISEIIKNQKNESTSSKDLPIRLIIDDLDLKRFLTTNYDTLLTNYFESKSREYRIDDGSKANPKDPPVPAFIARSYDGVQSSDLVLFGARLLRTSPAVFHLHGTAAADQNGTPNLIATERDYQKLYLRDDSNSELYREALDLAFAANTILFVGVGMRDEDLNRILRQFMANMPPRFDRQLFAIMEYPKFNEIASGLMDVPRPEYGAPADEKWNEAEAKESLAYEERHRMLRRYGVRVIYYDSENHSDRTTALCDHLRKIRDRWDRWWEAWLWSPPVRNADFLSFGEIGVKISQTTSDLGTFWAPRDKSAPLARTFTRHIALPTLPDGDTPSVEGGDWLMRAAQKEWRAAINEIKKMRHDPARGGTLYPLPVVLITGPRGAGRGSMVHRLLRGLDLSDALADALYPKIGDAAEWEIWRFFGSTNFSNEFMSVADGITHFLERIVENRPGSKNTNLQPQNVESAKQEASKEEEADTAQPDLDNSQNQTPSTWHTRLPDVLDMFLGRENRQVIAMIVISGLEHLVDRHGQLANRDLAIFFRHLIRASRASEGRLQLVFLARDGYWSDEALRDMGALENIDEQADVCRHTITLEAPLEIKADHQWLGDVDAWDTFSAAIGHHHYALALITRCINEISENDASARAKTASGLVRGLIHDVHRHSLRRQAELVADFVIRQLQACLDTSQMKSERCYAKDSLCDNAARFMFSRVLHILALCTTPLDKQTLKFLVLDKNATDIREVVGESSNKILEDLFSHVIKYMLGSLLICRFCPRRRHLGSQEEAAKYERYTVHNTVRKFIKRTLGHQPIPFAEPGYFELSAPESSGVGAPALQPEAMQHVHRLIQQLLFNVEDPEDSCASPVQNAVHHNEAKLRCCLHFFRSSLPLVQMLRCEGIEPQKSEHGGALGLLDQQRNLLVRLINGVRKASGLPDREIGEAPERSEQERIRLAKREGILYADEMIWIYNEVAMICRWQGDLIDARSILSQAEHIRKREQGTKKSEAWAHLLIQRGAVELEMGNIQRAIAHLRNVRGYQKDSGSLLEVRADAYLALADHIRGENGTARERYERVIDYCRKDSRLRSLSLFSRHLGDLLRRLGNLDEAAGRYEDALAAAATQPDLLNHTRIAQALVEAQKQNSDPGRANQYLDAAQAYARNTSMPRMEADAAAVRAKIRILQGEFDGAAAAAREAIAISAKRGMRLRALANSVTLGKVQALRGDRNNARRILTACYGSAQRMLYVAKAKEAQHELMLLN